MPKPIANIGEAPAQLAGVPCRFCRWMRYTFSFLSRDPRQASGIFSSRFQETSP